MLGDAVIRSKRPHELQLLDVIGNSFGGMTIRVVHDDVLRMTLVKVLPLLPGVDMEVEVVEVGQVFCQRCRHTRDVRRGSADLTGWPAALIGSRHGSRGEQTCSRDRKSTRLNSSHVEISYAVFCLKKK